MEIIINNWMIFLSISIAFLCVSPIAMLKNRVKLAWIYLILGYISFILMSLSIFIGGVKCG